MHGKAEHTLDYQTDNEVVSCLLLYRDCDDVQIIFHLCMCQNFIHFHNLMANCTGHNQFDT